MIKRNCTKNLKLCYDYAFSFLLTALLIVLLLSNYTTTVKRAINLWAISVVPAVFPFVFLTTSINSFSAFKVLSIKLSPISKRLFNVNGIVAYAYFLSLISGYPIGAKLVSDLRLKGLITKEESQRAVAFCSTPSPSFLISTVGRIMLGNAFYGLILLFCSIIASVLVGILFGFYHKKECQRIDLATQPLTEKFSLYDNVYNSVITVLIIGGIIALFYLLAEVLFSLKILSPIINAVCLLTKNESLSKGIVFGLFESTSGLSIITNCKFSSVTLPICAFLTGFGGLSIIAQSICYLKNAKIKTAPFVLSKILSAVLSTIICFIICLFL